MQRLVKNTGVVFGALTAERGAAAQPDHGLQAHVRRDRVQERRARGDDPHLPDLPAGVQAHARPRAEVLDGHRPADHRPAPGRPRPAADAARRARAGAGPRALLQEPRPGDHRVQDRHARHARGARRRAAAARRARPVPGSRSTRSSSTSRRRSGRSPTSSTTARPRCRPRRGRPAAAWATTCASSARSGAESASIWKERAPTNRGNSYFQPLSIASSQQDAGQAYNKFKITGQFDCENSGVKPAPTDGSPGCVVQNQNPFEPGYSFSFNGKKLQGAFPHVEADDYSSGAAASGNSK